MIFCWPGTAATIPTGWTRVTTLDAKYAIGAPASTNPGTTGGSSTHNHTVTDHTHTEVAHSHNFYSGTPNEAAQVGETGVALASGTHTHASKASANTTDTLANATVTLNTASNDPPYYEVIFCESDGTNDIGDDMVGWYNAAAPTGWQHCDGSAGVPDLRNKFLKGAAALGDGGGTGGSSDSHTHTDSGTHSHSSSGTHSHTATTSSNPTGVDGNLGGGVSCGTNKHNHSVSFGNTNAGGTSSTAVTIQNGDGQPVFTKLLPIQNISGSESFPNKIIGMWLGTLAAIPTDWYLCDGTNSTPDMRDQFCKGAANVGELLGTGGALAHGHTADAHGHTMSASHTHTPTGGNSSAGNLLQVFTTIISSTAPHPHTHNWTVDSSTATVNNATVTVGSTSSKGSYPPYVEVAFLEWHNPALGAKPIRTLTGAGL